jgi:hypothetical protein
MTDLRQAAQQALEALHCEKFNKAVTILREALARDHALHDLARLGQEIEQEPDRRVLQAEGKHPAPCARHCESKAFEIEIRSLNSRLKQAQPEQEPVAYYHPHKGFYWAKPTSIFAPTSVDVERLPLYTNPAQRPWVGLTDEELDYLCHLAYTGDEEFVLTVQAKLKEKNT